MNYAQVSKTQISKIYFPTSVSNFKSKGALCMSLNWEKSNKQTRMWRNGFESVSSSTPRSKPKKQVKTIGDAVLELPHLSGKRRSKAVKELLRNKRFRDLIQTEKKKKRKTSRSASEN